MRFSKTFHIFQAHKRFSGEITVLWCFHTSNTYHLTLPSVTLSFLLLKKELKFTLRLKMGQKILIRCKVLSNLVTSNHYDYCSEREKPFRACFFFLPVTPITQLWSQWCKNKHLCLTGVWTSLCCFIFFCEQDGSSSKLQLTIDGLLFCSANVSDKNSLKKYTSTIHWHIHNYISHFIYFVDAHR